MALSTRNKGDLMIGISAIVVLLGLGFVGYAGYYWRQHEAMRADGLLVEARVSNMQTQTSGSNRSRSTSYVVTVDFATKDAKSFREIGRAHV